MRDVLYDFIVSWAQSFHDTSFFLEDIAAAVLRQDVSFLNISRHNIRSVAAKSFNLYGVVVMNRISLCGVGAAFLIGGNVLCESALRRHSPEDLSNSWRFVTGQHLVQCFVWWRASGLLERHLISSLWSTRSLRWIGSYVVPKSACDVFRETLGDGDAGQYAELESAAQDACLLYGETMSKSGVFRTILHENAIPYAATVISEQFFWAKTYLANRATWRRVMKAHVTAFSVSVLETTLGLGVRCLGAAAGRRFGGGLWAYAGQHALHLASSRLLWRLVTAAGTRVLSNLESTFPPTQADIEADEREFEAQHESEEKIRDDMTTDFEPGEDSLYSVLCVPPSASVEDIKKQYKRLALTVHPDKLVHLSDAERAAKEADFKRINNAYTILSNPDRRARYDTDAMTRTPTPFIASIATLPTYLRLPASAGCTVALLYAAGFLLYAQNAALVKLMCRPGNDSIRMWG